MYIRAQTTLFVCLQGKENLRLPLVIMGTMVVLGGFTGLRLPETLHHRLPQTLEEGEEFGKDWTLDDCFRCIPIKPINASHSGSYEDLAKTISPTGLEMTAGISSSSTCDVEATEETPLEMTRYRRQTMKRIARQASVINTQRTHDGAMQLTYWF